MAAALKQGRAVRPSPMDILALRSWAKGYLVWVDRCDFHAAVDQLQEQAKAEGLIRAYGQDRIQEIIAAGFREGMPR